MNANVRGLHGGALLAVAWGLACAGQPPAPAPATDAPPRAAPQRRGDDLHALRGEALRATMQELDRVRRGRMPQELDEARATALQGEAIARSARSLAETAAQIESAAPLASLEADDREAFHRLASDLRERAAALAADARALPAAELRARLLEIDATCDACHRRYRDAPEGPAR